MLTKKQIEEIKEHLDKAQNPVFFFDNDDDGLCSFLLLRRYIGRGEGVAIKSFPELSENYFRKVKELNADYIFILDKPLVAKKFVERAKEINIPVVWIDHHEMENEILDYVNYFNPCNDGNGGEPVTVLCYQITKRKDDLWIAVIGAVTDGFLPKYYSEFLEKYPELGVKTENPFKVLYESKIGEIAMILSSGLKNTTTNVVSMIKFLISSKSPFEIFEENPKTFPMHKRNKQIKDKYTLLLEKAKLNNGNKKILFFKYSGDLSVSGELANHLKYLFLEKIIVVAYVKGNKVNLSLRGKNIKEKFLKVIEKFEGAGGGGHKDAVGGQMQEKDLDEFERELEG